MQANTLTTIEQLKYGDVFSFENNPAPYVLIPGEALRAGKKLFPHFAQPYLNARGSIKKIRSKTPVIFLQKSPAICI